MKAKTIDISISLRSDSQEKLARLTGYAYIEAGFLVGEFPVGAPFTVAEQVLLTAFTFTGCPIAARTSDPGLNPWLETAGAYVGRRQLISDDFEAHSVISSAPSATGMEMSLNLAYAGKVPSLCEIYQPFQECIKESKLGVFEGRFQLSFFTAQQQIVRTTATTIYDLPITRHYDPVWRNITIINSLKTHGITQIEQIDLFGNEIDAKKDLSDKMSVSLGRSLQSPSD